LNHHQLRRFCICIDVGVGVRVGVCGIAVGDGVATPAGGQRAQAGDSPGVGGFLAMARRDIVHGWRWWGGSGRRWRWGVRAAAAVVGVPRHCPGGSSATLARWRCWGGRERRACCGVGEAAVGPQWRGKMTEVAGVTCVAGALAACWGVRAVAGAVFPGLESSGASLRKGSDNRHVLGVGVWQGAGVGGGMASTMAAVGNDVPHAS
jgi:hypothetical protein